MDNTAIHTTVTAILNQVPNKAKRTWTTLHHTEDSYTTQAVDFTTCNLIVPLPNMSNIDKLKELIGDYNISYTVCRKNMPKHIDRFNTGSHRVLLCLSDNQIQITRSNAEDVVVSQYDWFVVDTSRTHSSTVVEGDPNQEFVIVENNWHTIGEIPQHLTAIAL